MIDTNTAYNNATFEDVCTKLISMLDREYKHALNELSNKKPLTEFEKNQQKTANLPKNNEPEARVFKFTSVKEVPVQTSEIPNQNASHSKVDKFIRIAAQMVNLYKKKNADYGDAFGRSFSKYGLNSTIIRLNDKLQRLESLANGNQRQVEDESICDTLMDIANYAVMTIIELDNKK